jgi:heavy metal efflux system protein
MTKGYKFLLRRAIQYRWITVAIAVTSFGASAWLMMSGIIGSEFLPHLDEGAIWARATLAPSTGPSAAINVMDRARIAIASFPEVTQVVSQVGRPDDGTDTADFSIRSTSSI